jgi:acetyl-CoA acetyltransferase
VKNRIDDVIYGCANQAGEDNRNVGRMSALLAGLPYQVPATTINRLCGSSLDAIAIAARAIKAGLMKRHPMVVSSIFWLRPKALSDLPIT